MTDQRSAAYAFRLTGDPQVVEIVADIVPPGGRVVGTVTLTEDTSEFSHGVWRWKIALDEEGSSSGGGFLRVPRRKR